MYNLLISGNDEAWENLDYEIESSRFLEYTNKDIADAFSTLTTENIESLKKLPCIFAYEGDEKPYRVGQLTEIKNRGRYIYIKYKFYDDIAPIEFNEISLISRALDLRNWETNRTHWAIKDGNLFEILEERGLLGESKSLSIEEVHLPKQKKTKEMRVTTVKGFIDKVFGINKTTEYEYFFRGHSLKDIYKLEPSLFRRDEKGNYLYLDQEDVMYRELIVSNSEDFSNDDNTLDKLVRMQHYSLPTRLLDITSNPLIALYFASVSNKNNDGEVIILSVKKNVIKYFDSDTASCISNLARLSHVEKQGIKFDLSDFNSQEPVNRLIHFIKEEKSFFLPKIKPLDLQRVICVKSKMSNKRIISQSGAFLLFGQDAVMNEKGNEDIELTRISIGNKQKILEELDYLNINDRIVFPYIENSARYIANKHKLINV